MCIHFNDEFIFHEILRIKYTIDFVLSYSPAGIWEKAMLLNKAMKAMVVHNFMIKGYVEV